MKDLQPLYQNLGYLFYSIASADKEVNAEESQKLIEEVKKEWLNWEDSEDEYGSDAAHLISIAFDYLNETIPTSDDAFEFFENYYKDNKEQFTEELKNKVFDTAKSIAHAFSGINKSELNKLGQLTLLFNK